MLKDGAFCIEFLPEENEVNYQYLYEIKQMAVKNGFKYFAKVPWVKGNFVSNTGRKAHNTEDVMIFSKGEPRSLKLDAKKNIQLATEHGIDVKGLSSYQVKDVLLANGLDVCYMKGTSGMLPKAFDFQPKTARIRSWKPKNRWSYWESIIEYISLPDELLLDQFGGSGNFAIACTNTKRNSIVIEKSEEMFAKMKENVEENLQKTDGKLDVAYENFESENTIEEDDYEYDA